MPVMDGDDFAREVRTDSPCRHVRLVALTAIRDPIAYTRTWSAGYDAHLEKPLTLEKLEDVAARLLSGRGLALRRSTLAAAPGAEAERSSER
ncbi:MAG: hypothetical protein DMD84_20185 [Candidatus Rokuibacteriota bacterium]|nr:MAG: hypothetical protein DMD84_20185 [Candidatus Rokubacteria bacterium]